MDYTQIDVQVDGALARVTLERPERLNALNPTMVQELRHFFGGLDARSAARVVILQGAGRVFCAGLDLKEMQTSGPRKNVTDMLQGQTDIRDIVLAMRRCPQPVIGIVQGAAAGGGFALALACDIRLATPEARMNVASVKLGLGGCDIGISYFLPRIVGASVAAELILTGRFIDAPRALALGLLSRVDELPALQAEAEALAGEMLATTPLALRLSKDVLNLSLDAPSMDAVIALEDRNQVLCTQGEDFAEGIAAFLEKRAPRYGPR